MSSLNALERHLGSFALGLMALPSSQRPIPVSSCLQLNCDSIKGNPLIPAIDRSIVALHKPQRMNYGFAKPVVSHLIPLYQRLVWEWVDPLSCPAWYTGGTPWGLVGREAYCKGCTAV